MSEVPLYHRLRAKRGQLETLKVLTLNRRLTVYQETGVPAISLPNGANSLPPDLVRPPPKPQHPTGVPRSYENAHPPRIPRMSLFTPAGAHYIVCIMMVKIMGMLCKKDSPSVPFAAHRDKSRE